MNEISRKCFVLAIFFALVAARAEAQMSFCFKSSDRNNLNLRFTIIDKDWKYGYVKYNKPEYAIFVKLKEEKLVDSYRDHPDLRKYTWDEVVNDTVIGSYQFMLQGASFSDFIYVRAKDKKKFRFESTGTGLVDCECDW